jgi:hypothetical protein
MPSRGLYYKTFYGRNLRIAGPLRLGPEPTRVKHLSGWKGLPKDEHSSLSRKSVNYVRKKFYSSYLKGIDGFGCWLVNERRPLSVNVIKLFYSSLIPRTKKL